ncbi:translocation/assembly module TamB domain-containing protein [Noviherbaspirillum sp. ST 5-3]|uniref:translocation/assembly module TamB domain-containing protein n=1 Tax=Noviherbaspirillum sp. ST 5-3 TaxID=3349878 RepID=UPI003916EFC7
MASERKFRWLRTTLLLLLGIAGLLIAGVAWMLATESGARTAFSLADSLASGLPQASGIRGRLIGPLRIDRMIVDSPGNRVSLSDITFDWRPAALLKRKLQIDTLHIAQLAITGKIDAKQEPPKLPQRIALPFALQADDVQIRSGEFNRGPVNLAHFGPIAFKLVFDGAEYRLDLRQFAAGSTSDQRTFTTSFSGTMRLSAEKPYPLDASLASSSNAMVKEQRLGVTGGIALSGSLAELVAKLDLAVNQAPIKGQATLRPFSPQVLGAAQLGTHALDLSGFDARLPQTALDIELSAAENGTGNLKLDNSAAGTYDEHKLPLSALAVSFRQDAGQFDFSAITARLGSDKSPAGTINGDGRYAGGALTLALRTDALDLKRIDRRVRSTSLAGRVDIRHASGRQEMTVALSEPLKERHITLDAHAVLADAELSIDKAQLQIGHGRIDASGSVAFNGRQGFKAQGKITDFRLQELGTFPEAPALELNSSFSLSGVRAPQLEADLSFKIADTRLAGQPLSGDGEAQLRADRLLVPRFLLQTGVNRLQVEGQLAQAGTQESKLTFVLNAPQLAQLGPGFDGVLQASGVARGSLVQPHIEAEWNASKVRAPGSLQLDTMQGKATVRLDRSRPFILDAAVADISATGLRYGNDGVTALTTQVRFAPQADALLNVTMQADGIAAGQIRVQRFKAAAQGTTGRHVLDAAVNEDGQSWSLKAEGGLDKIASEARWQGNINAFDATGRFTAHLASPAALLLSTQRVQLDRFMLNTDSGRIAVDQFARDANGIATRGRIERLQLAEILRHINPSPPVNTDLQMGGEWDVRIADALSGSIKLRRDSGDVTVLGNAPVTLGLQTLTAEANAANGHLQLQLRAEGRQLGRIDVDARSGIGTADSKIAIAQDAPISGSARIVLPALGAILPLVSPTLAADGRLQAEISAAGTFGDPRLSGRIDGDALRLAFADLGIDLRGGSLHGEFQGNQLLLQEASFQGAEGRVAASGPISFSGGEVAAQLTLHAEHFTLLNRVDRRVVVNGDSQVALRERHLKVTGALDIERGFFDLGRADKPRLSDDVVIVGRTEKPSSKMVAEIDVALASDGGIVLKGRGLNGTLGGKIRLLSNPGEKLRAQGTLSIIKGTYTAYGRELAIEQGLLRFNGAINNPSLDILAMRRGQEVEAGISVRGTALAPRVTLVSEPTVPDAEKLSWLVLGRGLASAGENDVGALQSAASTLLSESAAAGVQSGIASAFGLDTFSLGTSQDNLQQRIITVGKQLSSRLYLAYQQGLQTAESVVQLRYVLSPRLSLEAEGGTRSALSIFYNMAFD